MLLSISEARATFGGLHALDGASFTVGRGTTTGLIGPNGAGKTTLFNCISGLLPKASGRVVFDGQEVAGKRPEQISCAGLVRTFQLARGCPRMTVFEHLMLYGPRQRGEGSSRGSRRRRAAKREQEELAERALAVAKRLLLDHVLDNLVTALSGDRRSCSRSAAL